MQGLGAFLLDDLQIGLPHVRADEHDLGDDLLAHGGEKSLEGFDGSFFAHPKQTGDVEVDLVDQREVLVAFGVLDFIDADGVDLAQFPVFQAPGDDMFDGIEDLLPGSAERLGCLFPRKAAGPAGQKQHVRFGQGALAVAPGNFLDDHSAAAATVHSPHRVQEEDEKSPQREELKTSLGELIVTGRRLMAARADRARALAGPHRYLDTLVVRTEAVVMIDKSSKAVTTV